MFAVCGVGLGWGVCADDDWGEGRFESAGCDMGTRKNRFLSRTNSHGKQVVTMLTDSSILTPSSVVSVNREGFPDWDFNGRPQEREIGGIGVREIDKRFEG
jgi:hypothetical protein